jgi:Domain of unknown function (DUF4258)
LAALKLRAPQAERIIHRLARDSSKVILTTHAKDRMEERGIVRADLDRSLRTGSVLGSPFRNERGDWQCKIILRLVGSRDACAVTVIAKNDRLIIRTVEWEDWR